MSEFALGGNRYSLLRLFAVAVFFIVLAPVFWFHVQIHPDTIGAAYENADLYQSVYPSFHYGFSRLRAGQLPLWNAKQICGTPFLAQPSSALFQPLNAVFLFLATERAMAVHAFVCLAMMGIGFVMFGRALDLGYTASLIGGTMYAFCGASASAVSRPELAAVLAWTPFLFYGLRESMRQTRFGSVVPAGLAGAAVLLSGAPALSVLVLSAALGYGLFLGFWFRRVPRAPGTRERFERLIVIATVVIAVSTVQWLPTAIWLLRLDRPWDALWAAGLPAQVPVSLTEFFAQLLVPKPGALPRLAYLGAAAIAAAPVAFMHHASRRDAIFFVLAAAGLLALGLAGHGRMPLSFPYAHALFPAMFFLIALAAQGLDRILLTRPGTHALRRRYAAALFLVVAAFLFYVSPSEARGRLAVLFAVMAPVILLRWAPFSVLGGMVLLLALFADLITANPNLYAHPFADAPECYQRYGRTLQAAEEQANGARVLTAAPPLDFGLPCQLGMVRAGLYGAGGLSPLTGDQAIWWRRLGPDDPAPPVTERQMALLSPGAELPRLLDVMAVRAIVVAPDDPLYAGAFAHGGPRLAPVRSDDAARLFVNETAWPRVAWVPSWRVADGVAGALTVLGAADFDGTRECVIDRDSPGYETLAHVVAGPRAAGQSPPERPEGVTCTVEDHGAEHVIVRTQSAQPGITVLADTFDAGWKASVDGKAYPILRANGLFRGVAVPAGAHTIVFVYRPGSFWLGAAVALGTLALLALIGAVQYVRG